MRLDHELTPSIITECLFADPVADIAVLGEPDDQIFDPMTYGDFVVIVDGAETLSVGSTANDMRGWLRRPRAGNGEGTLERSMSFEPSRKLLKEIADRKEADDDINGWLKDLRCGRSRRASGRLYRRISAPSSRQHQRKKK